MGLRRSWDVRDGMMGTVLQGCFSKARCLLRYQRVSGCCLPMRCLCELLLSGTTVGFNGKGTNGS